jgi:hypothetical protein
MALTISNAGSGNSISNNTTLATGATVTANVGDWLVLLIAASNSGASGAATTFTPSDPAGNIWTQRAVINYNPSGINNGTTLAIFTAEVTSPLTSQAVTVTLGDNTPEKACIVKRVQPGAGETVQFVDCNTTGNVFTGINIAAPTVSVTSGDTIFGAAAVETDDAASADTDTTNGSWDAGLQTTADNGLDANAQSIITQYKTTTGTGNQSWAISFGASRDCAATYLILRPVAATGGGRSYGFIIG